MNRRQMILAGLAGAASTAAIGWAISKSGVNISEASEGFEISKSETEWLDLLGEKRFAVLRKEATERPFSSPLNDEKRAGIFACAGCDLPLYSSETKFDSGTGWPSFYDALPNAVGTREDKSFLMTRTEAHCSRCGGHLGHVFNDGPEPTGLRHCINGLTLKFVAS